MKVEPTTESASTITADAVDSTGRVGSTTISVDVQNLAAPVVEVSEPSDGTIFAFGRR